MFLTSCEESPESSRIGLFASDEESAELAVAADDDGNEDWPPPLTKIPLVMTDEGRKKASLRRPPSAMPVQLLSKSTVVKAAVDWWENLMDSSDEFGAFKNDENEAKAKPGNERAKPARYVLLQS